MGWVIFWIFLAVIIFGVISEQSKTPEQKISELYGAINDNMICPHCTEKGAIRTKAITQKKGVSGGKATAALLTGGVSLLATGLSRKEQNTQAYCMKCSNTWFF